MAEYDTREIVFFLCLGTIMLLMALKRSQQKTYDEWLRIFSFYVFTKYNLFFLVAFITFFITLKNLMGK